ncbi:uncharacterized protein LOC110705589 isoform X2 [Chenopodium quinoa]|uniref:uncharacterized protein LOC110705589 isoform X2 n=1 Tax=Chenopodium quinoa TaxID=63459 RepID=UPI000B78CA4D|nr:uncharacterized protein LOC110705589 isoform X2 [Chenopodium quinoa]
MTVSPIKIWFLMTPVLKWMRNTMQVILMRISGFFNGTVDACQKISSEDGEPHKVIVMGLSAIGSRSFSGIKRKRLTQAKLDLIPNLGPHCKRARSKMCKKSTFSWKEVDARDPTLHGSPAIAVMQKKLCALDGVDTFININPLKMDGVHAEAFNQEFCQLNGIGDDINAKERAPQVDHKITNQEITAINTLEFPLDVQKLPLLNNSLNKEVTTSGHHCHRSSNQGLGRSEASTFAICASSLRVCDAKVMDIEEEEMLHYNTPLLENDAIKEGKVPHKNAPHSEGYDIKEGGVVHSNASHSKGFGSKKREALCEHYEDYDLEEGEILDGNDEYSQDYDIEEGEIIDSHAFHFKDLSFSKVTMQRQPTQTLYRKLTEYLVPSKKLKIEMDDGLNVEILKESITCQDVCKEYDVEIQKLKKNLEDEKNKLDEVIKKNRQQMWKVVCELESTKKELQGKIIELAKKTDEVKMAKELATKECNKKEAYKLRLKACQKCRYH